MIPKIVGTEGKLLNIKPLLNTLNIELKWVLIFSLRCLLVFFSLIAGFFKLLSWIYSFFFKSKVLTKNIKNVALSTFLF